MTIYILVSLTFVLISAIALKILWDIKEAILSIYDCLDTIEEIMLEEPSAVVRTQWSERTLRSKSQGSKP